MQKTRDSGRSFDKSSKLPSQIMEEQRSAAENAVRIARAAREYIVSLNRAWIDLWNSRYTELMTIPKRVADTQCDFIERALNDYGQSLENMRTLTAKAQEETASLASRAVRESEAGARRLGTAAMGAGLGAAGERRDFEGDNGGSRAQEEHANTARGRSSAAEHTQQKRAAATLKEAASGSEPRNPAARSRTEVAEGRGGSRGARRAH